jgi:hypothetical protein
MTPRVAFLGVLLTLASPGCTRSYFKHETFLAERYVARDMRDAGEAPLWRGEGISRYRLLGPGGPGRSIIRIERTGQHVSVVAKTREGKLLATRKLSPAVWQRVAERVEAASFWSLPVEVESRVPGMVLHNEVCVVEGFEAGRHHVAVRWTSSTTPPFSALCELFFELAELESPYSRTFREVLEIPRGIAVDELPPEQRPPPGVGDGR